MKQYKLDVDIWLSRFTVKHNSEDPEEKAKDIRKEIFKRNV